MSVELETGGMSVCMERVVSVCVCFHLWRHWGVCRGVCVERLRVFGGRDVCMCVWRERHSLSN